MQLPMAIGGMQVQQQRRRQGCGYMLKGVSDFSSPLVMNAAVPLQIAQGTIDRALRLLEYQRRASRNYYDRNKEVIKARSVAYWEQNREAINERRRQRYQQRQQRAEEIPELR